MIFGIDLLFHSLLKKEGKGKEKNNKKKEKKKKIKLILKNANRKVRQK